jgi:glycosyltransferase involved in cell wall biosynthesis
MKKKVVIIAMLESIHTARWINQLDNVEFDIYLHPSFNDGCIRIHESIEQMTNIKFIDRYYKIHLFLKRKNIERLSQFFYFKYFNICNLLIKDYNKKNVAAFINKVKPELVHTLETQKAGYFYLSLLNNFIHIKTKWWHTNWGSDFYIFGKIESHKNTIIQILKNCDYYSCECLRDIELAKILGYKNNILPVYPNSGGFDLNYLNFLNNQSKLTSKRKFIMLKGYQGWAGRALFGIRALERCIDLLQDYTLVIHSNTEAQDIIIAIELLKFRTGLKVLLLPSKTPHKEILQYHSNSRISIGLSIGDAISTSMLEAMSVGSFPIQSNTACVNEWVKDGSTAFVVHPEDPQEIEIAIRCALTNNELVDSASEYNINLIKEKCSYEGLKSLTLNSYYKILKIQHV